MSANAVYRAFDGADRLLYVGCTNDVEARMRTHAASSPWAVFMARYTTEEHSSREAAEAAEARAIAEEHPRWNLNGRSVDHPDGFATSAQKAEWLRPERELASNVRRLRAEVARSRRKLRGLLLDLRMEEAMVKAMSNGAISLDDIDDDDLLDALS